MRKWLCMVACCLSVYVQAQVWTLKEKEPAAPGTWWCFRNTVTLEELPRSLELRLAADTKYWLWVNGELQVSEGGLKRGPNPSDTYCDVITSLPALRAGKNTVALLVWYFGKDGFSHRNSPTAGISFSLFCDGKEVEPDAKWRVNKHPAYYVPQGEQPNYRLAESNIGFDAVKDIPFMSPDYDDKKWKKATEISLEKAGWNQLVDRPIPFWKDYGLKPYAKTEMQGDTLLRAYLPYNAQITPYIRLKAPAGKCIRIRTDNYRGGSATNVFAEYRTCEGEQTFECKGWMNGHYVQYELPEGVEVLDVKYRETGYDTSFAGSFSCDDPMLTRLWDKSQRTLYITMRDTYMDCPDRERAQWWGDVVNELGEAFYALDEKAHLLTRKGIHELMGWQRADSTIFAPVPAGNYKDELPMQLRYRAMIESPLTTLWEGWGIGSEGFGGGTYNHAWSGGPLTILSQHIAGIETLEPAFRTFRVAPHPAHLNFIRTQVPLSGGRRIVFEMDKSAHNGTMYLRVPEGTSALVVLPAEFQRWSVNGELKNERQLTLSAGEWHFEMSEK
mgnify:CR=1 FL=1